MRVTLSSQPQPPLTSNLENVPCGSLFRKADGSVGLRLWDSYALLTRADGGYPTAAKRDDKAQLPNWQVETLPSGFRLTITQE